MDTHKHVNRVAVLIASTLICILCCIPSGLVLERSGDCGRKLCTCAITLDQGDASSEETELRLLLLTRVTPAKTSIAYRPLQVLECALNPLSRITWRDALEVTRPLYSSELIFDSVSPDVKVPPPRGV